MARKPLQCGLLGYAESASKTFRPVSLGFLVNRGNLSTSLLASVLEDRGGGIPPVAQAKGRKVP